MARIRSISGQSIARLTEGWRMALADAGCDTPEKASGLPGWLPAPVPGTAAQALVVSGISDQDLYARLQERPLWYRIMLDGPGQRILRFDGLATLCEVWLDGRRIACNDSMFLPIEIEVNLKEKSELYLHFLPLVAEALPGPSRRQRWRPHLIAAPHLRQARATLLGHMPGWCPSLPPVGPYRPVEVVTPGPLRAGRARVRTCVADGAGIVECTIDINGIRDSLTLCCAGRSAPLLPQSEGNLTARLVLPDVPLWWPHTHGEPALHDLRISGKNIEIDLGTVGFRTIMLDKGADNAGFALVVNGARIFCRGANWTNADLMRLPGGEEDYRPLLMRAREAGMNMLRVSGIMCREAPEFFEIADKLGILVWNDLNLGNFDYDFGDPRFRQTVMSELEALLDMTETNPSLAVVCGGSEIAQQAAMLSLPERIWNEPFFSEAFPATVAVRRPDVIAVPNSPWGGPLPFATNAGVSHYFGVGAYRRPLEDARRADIRFASECLAFANLPQPERLPTAAAPGSPDWKALVVRDLKADWDFEDVRDHYLALLYEVDPLRLRAEDPARYLALSSAVVGEVMETAFAEWRRVGSNTAGALVWTLSDLAPGFGWGVLDHQGVPKPAYHALGRAFRPVQAVLTDEGLNGLDVHVLNDAQYAKQTIITLTAYGADGLPVIEGTRALELPPRGALKLNSADLFGIFFDVTHAYRFGPPAHVVTVARLEDGEGNSLAESVHFPLGRAAAMQPARLSAEVSHDGAGWYVDLAADRLVQSVHIAMPGFEPSDDWFHLAPGRVRRIRLRGEGVPRGRIVALNDEEGLSIDGDATERG